MKIKTSISDLKKFLLAILNSYGMLFFSKNRFFSILILFVSFFIPVTGLTGLFAVFTSIAIGHLLGFDEDKIQSGLYSYSALLFGLGFATNFEPGTAFYLLVFIGSVLTLLISVSLNTKFTVKSLPGLSLAFIFTTWIMILASKQFSALGLTQRHIYWVNETYSIGGQQLVSLVQSIENFKMPVYIAGFFRSISAIIFQGNIIAGILLSIGLIIYSRIAFLLMIVGYSIALLFNFLMGGFSTGDLSYYNMGTNFMLVAMALGGFYLIASVRSFLWLLVSVPIAYLLVIGLGSITYNFGLPVFSMPFCIVVILFLYCLQLRKNPGKLVLTPIQYYSPEINLYRYLNGKERLMNEYYHSISLPVMGEWMVSQGYNGGMTHKGEWSSALDFVLLDDEMKTYRLPGNLPEHFYCFNKPVTAPADGIVEEIIDYVEDNDIGKNNTQQNWGNTLIIKHTAGLYSKLSHLKKNSFKVTKGSFVKKGDIVALCGNSGRSPEPHLHFQLQSTPYIGSKTLHYPISYFYTNNGKETSLQNFGIPQEGKFVSNVLPDSILQKAFDFQPGLIMEVVSEGFEKELWEVFTDAYNQSYLYCKIHNAYAYFNNNGKMFYFTNYIGHKNTLLYYFYQTAFKVLLSSEKQIVIKDNYPLNHIAFHPAKWIQDVFSPFYIFIKVLFESSINKSADASVSNQLIFESVQTRSYFGVKKTISHSQLVIENNFIQSIKVTSPQQTIQISCNQLS